MSDANSDAEESREDVVRACRDCGQQVTVRWHADGDPALWTCSDCGLRDEHETVGPEHTSKHELTQWLKSHGAGVIWEESNPWGHETFSIEREHTGGRPDLLILIGGETFAVEYKTAESVGQVYDALPQLIQYWTEHTTTDQEYVADGVKFRIDGFLTATSHSPAGRLFPRYAEIRQDHLDMDETRRGCHDWGQLPPAEYRMTEQHVRTMWRLVKEAGVRGATDSHTPHIGSLLSDALTTPSADPAPAVLWNKGQTNQSWEVFNS